MFQKHNSVCISELCVIYHLAKTSIFGKHVSSVSLAFLYPALYIKKIAIDEIKFDGMDPLIKEANKGLAKFICGPPLVHNNVVRELYYTSSAMVAANMSVHHSLEDGRTSSVGQIWNCNKISERIHSSGLKESKGGPGQFYSCDYGPYT
ncbi:unnamed protein product [Sphenostylis stenocarpa]|uniref:Uncharacterized protein n=1 Tax=Sphenostylis stenocarpa TaxID=92480 RepID=A0AA86VX34_9FABA|nr:unnamed protein product [Sphenostylis stenocarpa]